MELLIILIIMAVASVMMYMQLKGTKPDVVPVMNLPRKTSPKKSAAVEKKVVENWDKPETKSASPSPDSKKKGKKRFDPVKAGQDMVAQKKAEETSTLRERKPAEEMEKDERKAEKTARKQGFVMVEEKKITRKAAPIEAIPADDEPVNETVARLRAILEGNKPAYNGPPRDFEKSKDNSKPSFTAGPVDHEAIAKKLKEQRDEKMVQREARNTSNKGGKVIQGNVASAATLSTGQSWGTFLKKDTPEAEATEAVEATEDVVADEE